MDQLEKKLHTVGDLAVQTAQEVAVLRSELQIMFFASGSAITRLTEESAAYNEGKAAVAHGRSGSTASCSSAWRRRQNHFRLRVKVCKLFAPLIPPGPSRVSPKRSASGDGDETRRSRRPRALDDNF